MKCKKACFALAVVATLVLLSIAPAKFVVQKRQMAPLESSNTANVDSGKLEFYLNKMKLPDNDLNIHLEPAIGNQKEILEKLETLKTYSNTVVSDDKTMKLAITVMCDLAESNKYYLVGECEMLKASAPFSLREFSFTSTGFAWENMGSDNYSYVVFDNDKKFFSNNPIPQIGENFHILVNSIGITGVPLRFSSKMDDDKIKFNNPTVQFWAVAYVRDAGARSLEMTFKAGRSESSENYVRIQWFHENNS